MMRENGTGFRAWLFLVAANVVMLAGCMDALEKQGQKTGSIIGKTTQDVKQFDPNAKQIVSDSKVRIEPSPTYALEAYRPILEQATKLSIHHALEIFRGLNDRYPKDHAEFMQKIIKENQIHLPVLPEKYQYAYDVENHELQIVKSLEDGGAAANGDGKAAK